MTNKTMQELNKIEEELQAIVVDGNEKVEAYLQEVETAKENEKEAKKAIVKAKQDGNVDAYAKANQDLRTAKDVVEFYSSKVDEIKDDPYITKVEYNEYTKRIKSEMDEINKNAGKRASKLLQELEIIRDEVMPATNKTNELLKNLQNNIYKYSAEQQMKEAKENKTPLNSDKLKNEYKEYSIAQGIRYILESNSAKNIKAKGNK